MKKIIASLSIFVASLVIASPAFALALPCPTNTGSRADVRNFSTLCTKVSKPNEVISSIITAILVVVVLIALVFLIWGGLKWVMSGGDKSKVETARNTIIGAIIGLIIAFLAFFIINFVGSIFGITLIGGSQGSFIKPIFSPDSSSSSTYCGGSEQAPCPVVERSGTSVTTHYMCGTIEVSSGTQSCPK